MDTVSLVKDDPQNGTAGILAGKNHKVRPSSLLTNQLKNFHFNYQRGLRSTTKLGVDDIDEHSQENLSQ